MEFDVVEGEKVKLWERAGSSSAGCAVVLWFEQAPDGIRGDEWFTDGMQVGTEWLRFAARCLPDLSVLLRVRRQRT